ncbi:glycosyl hydrolase [Phytohabitans sp. ZYX-F-186]|uniref:Glycosyl hydrolase n=1 Tax=Phytohabitans maris TaxID=3071409 RepID=A0ABU0ZRC9_9ACTN|nr:glycosyl hydrolase [Phytohabitans sp. ZYX-F-186]MDQ7909032.1 glycosyl hydrolase [Phytohabitans sp. ZYX-F-186]
MTAAVSRRSLLKAGAATSASALVGVSVGTTPSYAGSARIAPEFQAPGLDARPMARMWFPDAGAGADAEGLALVAKQIKDLAQGGFGGVEISYLSDNTNYTNADAKTIGWGSENWRRVLKKALSTANSVKDGFKIDITITSHWPPIVNSIDPNDDAQQQEVSYAYRKITTADLTGPSALPLPARKVKDYARGTLVADFLFVDKFVAATVARVASVAADGTPVFAIGSLVDVSAATSRQQAGAGYAAGVPDRAYAEANGIDYADIVAKFGPDPVDADFTGKIDADGNRRRMADWQYLYQTDLSRVTALDSYGPSAGDSLAVGDYVLFGTYRRGTGQVMSGGASVTIYNRSYATDYFNRAGVQQVFDFWTAHILDRELRSLLKTNGKLGSSIFEDSIEIHNEGPLWTRDMLAEFKSVNGYDPVRYAPVLALGAAARFDDSALAERIVEDKNLTLGHLYETAHAELISEWTATFGYSYRAQAYRLPGLDFAGAAAAVDIPEGDNSTAGDGLRNIAAAINMTGGRLLSMETTTFSADINSTWKYVAKEVNKDLSHGVNRSIFHGSAFARSFNRYQSEWPGWNFSSPGFSSWNARQIWWADVRAFTGYVTRSQAVMQAGKAKVDLAVLLGTDTGYSVQTGNSLQELLNRGYCYNLLSEALLSGKQATVRDGVLAPDGPAYKALVVRGAIRMSAPIAKKLLEYADRGLRIVLFNSAIARVYGTNKPDNNDTLLISRLAALTAHRNVATVATESELLEHLERWKVTPAGRYHVPNLEATRRATKDTDYYYLYNNGTTLAAAAAPGDTGLRLVSTAGLSTGDTLTVDIGAKAERVTIAQIPSPAPAALAPNVTLTAPLVQGHAGPAAASGPWGVSKGAVVSSLTDQRITLAGDGVPYLLDAWTGEVARIAEYEATGGAVTLRLDLEPRDAAIVALARGSSAKQVHAVDVSAGGVRLLAGGSLVHRATAAGTYTVRLSTGTRRTVTVRAVPEPPALSEGWTLRLESWGPDPATNAVDPTVSAKTTVTFAGVPLGTWDQLPATAAQLDTLGVASMASVSGIGRYTRTFTLPRTWDRTAGALLHLEHRDDMVVQVRVNGRDVGAVDQFTDIVDVSGYLRAGLNTVRIQLDTSLNNRRGVTGGASGAQTYGLTAARLVPFVQTILAG